MNLMPIRFSSLVTALAMVFAWIPDAHAYIDPGSGSVLTTAILGAIAAIGYTFRKYYYKLRDFVAGSPPEEPSAPQESAADVKAER